MRKINERTLPRALFMSDLFLQVVSFCLYNKTFIHNPFQPFVHDALILRFPHEDTITFLNLLKALIDYGLRRKDINENHFVRLKNFFVCFSQWEIISEIVLPLHQFS